MDFSKIKTIPLRTLWTSAVVLFIASMALPWGIFILPTTLILLAMIPITIMRLFTENKAIKNFEPAKDSLQPLPSVVTQKLCVCKSCGTVGKPKKDAKGSILIELVLWCCFIVPGLVYTLWRDSNRFKKCAVCGSADMIPLNSPMGKKLTEM